MVSDRLLLLNIALLFYANFTEITIDGQFIEFEV
jgi:hypothetical protein